MKKSNWLILAAFAVASAGLRIGQLITGFEDSGLAVRGNLCGLLLPAVLIAAAACFFIAARSLPTGQDAAGLGERFGFGDAAAVLCAVAGAFLVMAGAAALLLGGAPSLLTLLLAVFAVAAAVSVLYVVFALRRGNDVQGVALLVPVCALVVLLIVQYRSDASDPVLARVYIGLLAIAALTLSAMERAAFAFRNGSPRVWFVVDAMSVILSFTLAAERRSPGSVLLFTGCAAIELGFLAAADFTREPE